jgi:hypothetical protein
LGQKGGIQVVLAVVRDDHRRQLAVVAFPEAVVARELEPAGVIGPERRQPGVAGHAGVLVCDHESGVTKKFDQHA